MRKFIIIMFLLFAVWGCAEKMQKPLNTKLTEPISLALQFDDFNYSQCVGEDDRGGKIKDIVLRYVSGSRDFDGDGEADGYAMIATPLLADYDVSLIQGDAVVRLYRVVRQGSANIVVQKPLFRWNVSSNYLHANWHQTNMLDGYVIRLDWGDEAMAAGQYLLLLELRYKDGDRVRRIFQEVRFDEKEY